MSAPSWPGQEVTQAPQAAPAQRTSPALRPVLTLPNPDQQHDNAVQDAQLGLSQTQTGISVESNARQAKSSSIEDARKLRDSFDGLPPVREYRAVLPQLLTALNAKDDATGDNTLLYAYAKAMDPGSVVRESETASARGGASVFDSAVADLKKQLGIDGGGALAPDIRARLKRDVNNKVVELERIYRGQRQRFSQDASYYGIDPARVVGPHDFDIYREPYKQAYRRVFKQDENPFAGLPGKSASGEGWSPEQSRERWGGDYFDEAGQPLGPEGGMGYDASGQPVGLMARVSDDSYMGELDAELKRRGVDPTSTASYYDRFLQGATLGMADELQGIEGGIEALFDDRGVGSGYTRERDLYRRNLEKGRQQQGTVGTALEVAGGIVPALLARNPSSIASAARQGAAMGGAAGFGYGEGLEESMAGAGLGAAAGGAIGAGAQKGMEALAARRATQAPTQSAEVIGAADRLNARVGSDIRPMPADVSGPGIRNLSGGAAKLPLGAQPIVRGSQKVSQEAQVARDAIAKLAGDPAELETAGEAALVGAQKYIQASRSKVGALYNKARQLGGAEPVDLASARDVLDRNIAELQRIPGGASGLNELQSLRAELDRPFSVEGVKGMRTTLRDRFMKDGLRGSDIERRVGQVVDAAEEDIVSSLQAAGKPQAAEAYAQAAAAHKERVELIDSVLAPIIGAKGSAPRSGEEIMAAISRATQQNNVRLGKFLSSIPPEDASTVRATLIANLGHGSKGTQNATGDAFSLPQFLTHWNAITPGAKRTLFGGELRSALDDLAKVAEGTKGAQAFANFSNTGSPVGLAATGLGGGAGFTTAPLTTTTLIAGQYGLGRLLASPKFARWLAKVPSDPKRMPAYAGQLSRIAATDTVIAADAMGLQRQLQHVFAVGPERLAATPRSRSEGAEKAKTEEAVR